METHYTVKIVKILILTLTNLLFFVCRFNEDEKKLYECSECNAQMYVFQEGIQNESTYFGKVEQISAHDCDWWMNVRSTLQYLILVRRYVESMNSNKLTNDLAFLIENVDIKCEQPVLFVYGHKLTKKTTKFLQAYRCNARTCRDHTVQIIGRNGPLCELTSRHATESNDLNKNTFVYNPDASDHLPFLDIHCTTAYMIRRGSVSSHLFGKGMIDILPHLEQIILGMNWFDTSLYAHRSSIDSVDSDDSDSDNARFAAMEIPDAFFSNVDDNRDIYHDDDNDGDQQTDVARITTELRRQIEVYILICLGEIFQPNYFEATKSDLSNQKNIERYTLFTDNVTALLGMLQDLINKRNPNQNINNIIEQVIDAEDFIIYPTILMDGDCIICNVSATEDDEPNIKNQTIKDKFGLSHAVVTCKKCSDLIKAIYLASSIERQTKTTINSFVMSQSTDADFEAKMMSIFQSPYFKSKVKMKAFCIKTKATIITSYRNILFSD